MSIGIADIKVIRVVKKSKFWKGAGTGFLIGGSFVLLTASEAPVEEDGEWLWYAFWVVVIGVPCALIGGLIGASSGRDKIIQIEGMTDSEIKEAMDKLSKKARIRDYK